MRRYIALAALGGLVTLFGHAVVSLGLHPEGLTSAAALLQGGAALMVGAAFFVTGMLGVADGYEKVARRVSDLLDVKEIDGEDTSLQIRDLDGLHQGNALFWRGYVRATGGVTVFMAGLLGLAATLYHSSVEMFAVGVGAGAIALGVAALLLAVRGLRNLRRAHAGADASARRMERFPDRRVETEAPAPRRRVRYDLFRRHRGATERGLDRQPRSTPRETERQTARP